MLNFHFEVTLKSPKLEAHLFMKRMQWLTSRLGSSLKELCTDGHITIASLMGEYFFCFSFLRQFHVLVLKGMCNGK